MLRIDMSTSIRDVTFSVECGINGDIFMVNLKYWEKIVLK